MSVFAGWTRLWIEGWSGFGLVLEIRARSALDAYLDRGLVWLRHVLGPCAGVRFEILASAQMVLEAEGLRCGVVVDRIAGGRFEICTRASLALEA